MNEDQKEKWTADIDKHALPPVEQPEDVQPSQSLAEEGTPTAMRQQIKINSQNPPGANGEIHDQGMMISQQPQKQPADADASVTSTVPLAPKKTTEMDGEALAVADQAHHGSAKINQPFQRESPLS